MKIIKATPKDLAYIVHLARQEFESIGFIPVSRYEKICKGESGGDTLDICFENGDPVGFCYASHNKYGTTKIQQICIQEDARLQERASALVDAATLPSDSYMSLRCAADLAANQFWQALGFQPIRRRSGGSSRQREIQVYGKFTGGLFKQKGNCDD